MSSTPKDENSATAIGGQSSVSPRQVVPIAVNPTTNAVVVQLV